MKNISKKEYLTDREIHVIGIQRTGQHAITSWLIGHFPTVLYKNNMSQAGRRRGVSGIEPPFWWFSPDVREEKYDLDTFRFGVDQAIILGTEFTIYDVGLNPNLVKQKKKLCKEFNSDKFSKREDYLLVIRNPYNQYASVLNWGRNKQLSPVKNFSSMWKRVAKECLGDTNLIPDPKIVVKYDDWFSSKGYREDLSKKLSLSHTDRRLNTVMKVGVGKSWGSSFDGMKKKGDAQSMSVLSRWEKVKDDPRFIELCNDEDLKGLAKKLGWECPI